MTMHFCSTYGQMEINHSMLSKTPQKIQALKSFDMNEFKLCGLFQKNNLERFLIQFVFWMRYNWLLKLFGKFKILK